MTKRWEISSYVLGDMRLIYEQDEEQNTGMVLIPEACKDLLAVRKDYKVESLVQVKLLGDDYPFGFSQGRTMRNSESTGRIAYVGQECCVEEMTTRIVTCLEDARGYRYHHMVTYDVQSKALEIETEIINASGHEVTVELLSGFTLGGITPFDEEAEEGQLILHRLQSTWSAEGRLESRPLEELQLEPSWQKFSSNSIRYGQVGSMPVRGYVPFAAVEDNKHGVTWGVQLYHASSWQMEAYRRDEALVLSGGLADREFGQWFKTLKAGEGFKAPKVMITTAKGTLDQVTGRLTEHIRKNLELPKSEQQKLPVIFNEFCTSWGAPREEHLIAMAHILKGRGIDYFVIDAGWYVEDAYAKTAVNWDAIGDWEISKSRFPSGLRTTVDVIKSCGMKPGIWFEFEIAGRGSRLFEKSEWMLKRDGCDIVSGHRKFLDMRKPEVQDYLADKVLGFLKTYGLEYLKVDYNETIGIGCDGDGSQGEGLRRQIQASLDFFHRIHEEMPELVIEICSSGGHRLVPAFLEFASMASFSDAHECDEIPVIAANMHRMILPRQSQIWAVLQKEHTLETLYYRMTGTMLGRLCLSGKIEELGEEQWKVVQEGMDFYRQVSQVIDCGESTFQGTEIRSYRKPVGWQAVLRRTPEALLVAFHSFLNPPARVAVRLPAGYGPAGGYHKETMTAGIGQDGLELEGIGAFDGAAFYFRKAGCGDRVLEG